MPSSPRTALIVGAGIGGLAAGIALRRAGWDVRIFERAPNPRELGFALVLAPNAMAALGELGLADAVRKGGIVAERGEMRRADGRLLRRFDIGSGATSGNQPTVVVLRPVLHGALLAAVGADALSLGSEAAGFQAAGDKVVLALAGGRTVEGDVLIGADGVGSVIRRQLHPTEAPPRPSGFMAVRGVAQDVVHLLGGVTGRGYLGPGIEFGTAQASASAVYWYASLLETDLSPGQRVAVDARSLIRRPMESFDEAARMIVEATQPQDMRADLLLERAPIESWGNGPVTLLGDAAHPMLPHAGQGAAQALEDAVGLGLALTPAGDVGVALRRYERVRSRRTRDIVTLARRIARVTTTRSAIVGALRNMAVRLVPARALAGSSAFSGRHDANRELR